tara:strand:+ start:35 stop:229 length:195 start_codon:yes stop_codon:yes gene_type:complete
MSKVEKVSKDEVLKPIEEKIKEAEESLRIQIEEYAKLEEHNRTMRIKAQGALEVLIQLNSEDNK